MAAATSTRSPSSIGLRLISTGNSRAVAAADQQLQPAPIGRTRTLRKNARGARLPRAKALRHQVLDVLANDLIVRIAEQRRDLAVGESDDARRIDDDHRIRRGIERAARKFGRGR